MYICTLFVPENRCAVRIVFDGRLRLNLNLFIMFNSSEAPPNSFITHYWKFPETRGYLIEEGFYETITLLESRTTIEAGTTGLRTWKASLVLAQYLIQHPCESQWQLIITASITPIDEQTLWTPPTRSSWVVEQDSSASWSQVCSSTLQSLLLIARHHLFI